MSQETETEKGAVKREQNMKQTWSFIFICLFHDFWDKYEIEITVKWNI